MVDREVLASMAKRAALAARVPPGFRIVVAVTDETGDWVGVGVGSNTNAADVAAILRAALYGAERVDHPNAGVIDVDAEER